MEEGADNTVSRKEGLLPPEPVGTPADVQAEEGEEIRWWRPSWRDAFRHVGYRWLLLVPLLSLAGIVMVGLCFVPGGVLFALGFKGLVLAVGGGLSLAGYAVRKAVQARTEPFCIFCGYNLTGLPDNYRCPECGRHYTWRMIEAYRRDPQWFIERFKAHKELPSADEPFEAGPVRRRRKARDGTE